MEWIAVVWVVSLVTIVVLLLIAPEIDFGD